MANQGNYGNKILWGTFVCQSEGRKKFLSAAYWPSHSMYYFQNCLNFQTDYTITYYHIMLKVRYSQKKYWHYYNCPKNVLRCILSFVFWIFPPSVQLESADSKHNTITKSLFQDSFQHIFWAMRKMHHTFWKKATFTSFWGLVHPFTFIDFGI